MKKILLSGFVALAFVSCQKETTNTTTTTPATTGTEVAATTPASVDPATAPVMTFETDIFDLGDVQAGSTTDKTIEFTNTGQSPLLITNAKASCGCTVPKYSDQPIAPGETGTLDVKFTAPANNGSQTKTVTLTTNTSAMTETFRIKANVVGGAAAPQPAPQQMQQPAQLPAPRLENLN
ncbi:MAG: DUF1573 domain-containing protein [Weeksellaceae bacterium]|nr:DUF1573 domain-containing protein [Weeksellaceae bacterium]